MIRILKPGDKDDEGREAIAVDHDTMTYQTRDSAEPKRMPGVKAYRDIMLSKARKFSEEARAGTGIGEEVLKKYGVVATSFGDRTKALAFAFTKEEYDRIRQSEGH